MYRSATVELALVCRGCSGEVNVSTLTDEVECPRCRESTSIPWGGLLDVNVRGEQVSIVDVLAGLPVDASVPGARAGVKLTVTAGPARCRCGEAIPLEAIRSLSRIRKTIACAACGAETPGRRPPHQLVDEYPTALFVLGEGVARPFSIVFKTQV